MATGLARNRLEVSRQPRCDRELSQVRGELAGLARLVVERKLLRVRLEEEIEGIEHRHLGDEIHLDAQLPRLFGESESREIVGLGVLLPVDEVLGRLDAQRVAENPRAAMRRGAQTHALGTK